MAFSKKQKEAMLAQYEQWVQQSEAVFMLEFKKMNMKEIDAFRAKVREAGGQLHVAKNTLLRIALERAGVKNTDIVEGTTLCGIAPVEAPAIAKILSDATKNSEVFRIKGGLLDGKMISEGEVKALAGLPPLPVMRARLLGMITTPATQLVRTLAEPARSLAAVVKAYSEKQPAAV